MKRVLRAVVGSALCLTLASALALAAPARDSKPRIQTPETSYRVADFAVDLVAAMGHGRQTPENAMATLRSRGVVVSNPSKPATESDIVGMLSQAGITVTTKSPNKLPSRS